VSHMVTISSKGQLVIPAELRKKYRLKAGTKVAVHDRDGHFTVTPDPYDAFLASRGILRDVSEDVDAWMMNEKRKEREREAAKFKGGQ
jgi:AbrB family looped-hinge helix DNA binding protein